MGTPDIGVMYPTSDTKCYVAGCVSSVSSGFCSMAHSGDDTSQQMLIKSRRQKVVLIPHGGITVTVGESGSVLPLLF